MPSSSLSQEGSRLKLSKVSDFKFELLAMHTSDQNQQFRSLDFVVKDTGVGIPQSELSKLFKMFGMANTNKKLNSKGTGLGLTISKKLVENLGGEIQVESLEGMGTAVSLNISKHSNHSLSPFSLLKINFENVVEAVPAQIPIEDMKSSNAFKLVTFGKSTHKHIRYFRF